MGATSLVNVTLALAAAACSDADASTADCRSAAAAKSPVTPRAIAQLTTRVRFMAASESSTTHRDLHEPVRPTTLRVPGIGHTRHVVRAQAQHVVARLTERGGGRRVAACRGRATGRL